MTQMKSGGRPFLDAPYGVDPLGFGSVGIRLHDQGAFLIHLIER